MTFKNKAVWISEDSSRARVSCQHFNHREASLTAGNILHEEVKGPSLSGEKSKIIQTLSFNPLMSSHDLSCDSLRGSWPPGWEPQVCIREVVSAEVWVSFSFPSVFSLICFWRIHFHQTESAKMWRHHYRRHKNTPSVQFQRTLMTWQVLYTLKQNLDHIRGFET